MTESRTENALKNSAASLALRAVAMLSQFALRTVFIRVLGAEYAGVTGLFTDILSVLSLAELGLDASLLYALYRPLAENDAGRTASVLRFYRRAFRLAGAAVLLGGLACTPFLQYIVRDAPAVREDLRFIFLFCVVNTALGCFFDEYAALLKARQQSRVVSLYWMAAQISECALSACLLCVTGRLAAWLLVRCAVQLAKNIAVRVHARRGGAAFFSGAEPLPREDVKELRKYFFCLSAYQLSGVAVNGTDSIFISALFGAAKVAAAGNYALLVSGVRVCVEQVAAAVRPSVGHLAAVAPAEKQYAVFRRMNFAAFYAACVGSVCLYTLLDAFIGGVWLDPSYCLPASAAALLTANFYISVMVYPVESFRNANGLFLRGWGRPVATAALNLALDGLLGRYFGVSGIFAATVIARAATQVWFDPCLVFRYAFRRKPGGYFREYLLQAALTAVLCAAASAVASLPVITGPVVSFMWRAAVALIVPNVILLLIYRRNGEFLALAAMARKTVFFVARAARNALLRIRRRDPR